MFSLFFLHKPIFVANLMLPELRRVQKHEEKENAEMEIAEV